MGDQKPFSRPLKMGNPIWIPYRCIPISAWWFLVYSPNIHLDFASVIHRQCLQKRYRPVNQHNSGAWPIEVPWFAYWTIQYIYIYNISVNVYVYIYILHIYIYTYWWSSIAAKCLFHPAMPCCRAIRFRSFLCSDATKCLERRCGIEPFSHYLVCEVKTVIVMGLSINQGFTESYLIISDLSVLNLFFL